MLSSLVAQIFLLFFLLLQGKIFLPLELLCLPRLADWQFFLSQSLVFVESLSCLQSFAFFHLYLLSPEIFAMTLSFLVLEIFRLVSSLCLYVFTHKKRKFFLRFFLIKKQEPEIVL